MIVTYGGSHVVVTFGMHFSADRSLKDTLGRKTMAGEIDNSIGDCKLYHELIHDDKNGGLTLHDIWATILFKIEWEDGTELSFTEIDMTCAWIYRFVEDADIWRAGE